MVEDLASPLTLLTLVYCELCWHVLLFWNRLGRSQQTASEKVFWSGRLLDLRWIRSAGRSILSALHAPQTCLLFLWMEIASTTALRMQQGTFKMCVICSVVKVTLAVSYWRSMCIFLSFRSEEKALFDGIFIAKDDEVERFVDYIHSTTNHVNLFYNISKKKNTNNILTLFGWFLTFFNNLFPFCRSLEEVSVEGSGQLQGKRLRNPQVKLMRRDLSLQSVDMEFFSPLSTCSGEKYMLIPSTCRTSWQIRQ